MSERKVLSKYYPPDFDPSQIQRTRGPKAAGPKVQPVRLMAPFSMKCTSCGEYIYKGRKFNARKEAPPNEHYLNIQIYRFYIRCTRCSAEITFKTDPQNMDYVCERGARRNTEAWRPTDVDESTEERLDRLEREEADASEEHDAMQDLEAKALDGRREEQVADALDAIRTRNALRDRAGQAISVQKQGVAQEEEDDDRDAALAKKAFQNKKRLLEDDTSESVTDPHQEGQTDLWNTAKRKKKKPRPHLLSGLVKKS